MEILQPLLGLVALLGVAWLLSSDRKKVSWRPVVGGIALQAAFALLVLRTGIGRGFFRGAQAVFTSLLDYAKEGASRVIGPGSLGMEPGSAPVLGAVILASVIFFSAVFALLHHLGIVRLIVGGMAYLMAKTMGTSGAESSSAAANIFVGQTEAPLLIRPYLPKMTRSELGTVMVVGFATVAGGVFGIYVEMMRESVPDIAGHLLSASVMSAPMGLVVAKLMFPETDEPETLGRDVQQPKSVYSNSVDAVASGAGDGLKLALNIIGMLIAFLALLALVNGLLGTVQEWVAGPEAAARNPLTLQGIFGWVLAPVAWLLGVSWGECSEVGALLGTKVAVNEYVAFDMLARNEVLSERARWIASYALCGFANFSSIAIQIGGLGGMCPERRGEIAGLGLKAMLGGALASWATACTAALLL